MNWTGCQIQSGNSSVSEPFFHDWPLQFLDFFGECLYLLFDLIHFRQTFSFVSPKNWRQEKMLWDYPRETERSLDYPTFLKVVATWTSSTTSLVFQTLLYTTYISSAYILQILHQKQSTYVLTSACDVVILISIHSLYMYKSYGHFQIMVKCP